MKRLRTRLLIGAAIVAVALAISLLIGRVHRRELVEPILRVLTAIGFQLDRLPQALPWAVFLGVGLLLAVGSLSGQRAPLPSQPEDRTVWPGRVASLARLVVETRRGGYFRVRLTRYLLNLTLEAEDHHEPLSEQQAVQRIFDSALPPHAKAYLSEGLKMTSGDSDRRMPLLSRLQSLLQRLRPDFYADLSDIAGLDQLIQYLENELEISYDYRDR